MTIVFHYALKQDRGNKVYLMSMSIKQVAMSQYTILFELSTSKFCVIL